MLELLRDPCVTFAMGVSLLSRSALACQAKANLHPLAFYTIELTSPRNGPSGGDLIVPRCKLRAYRVDFPVSETFRFLIRWRTVADQTRNTELQEV